MRSLYETEHAKEKKRQEEEAKLLETVKTLQKDNAFLKETIESYEKAIQEVLA